MQLDPGLLAAVIAEPENDLPRLMMADWLDERGEEARAEFIRVQCELARLQSGITFELPQPQPYRLRVNGEPVGSAGR